MIKISGCLFWLQSTLFKSCFSDVADFLRTEGGDAGSPRFATFIPPCSHAWLRGRTDVLVPPAARAGLGPALSSRISECLPPCSQTPGAASQTQVPLTATSQASEVSCLPHNTGIISNYYHLEPCLHLSEENANSECNYSLN